MTLEQIIEYALESPKTSHEEAEAPPQGRPAGNHLSARELEVLGLVAEGLTDARVAERLYLSPRTVGWHLQSIYARLGVRSRTAAVRRASDLGLL